MLVYSIILAFSILFAIYLLKTTRARANNLIFIAGIFVLVFPFSDFINSSKSFLFSNITFLILFSIYLLKNINVKKYYDKTFSGHLAIVITFFYGLVYSLIRFYSSDTGYLFYYFYLIVQAGLVYFLYYNIIDNIDFYDKLYKYICILGLIISSYLIYEFTLLSFEQVFLQIAYMDVHDKVLSPWDAYQKTLSSGRELGFTMRWMGGTNARAYILLLLYSYLLQINLIKKNRPLSVLRIISLGLIVLAIILQVSRSAYLFFIIINLTYFYFNTRDIKSLSKNSIFFLVTITIFIFSYSEIIIVSNKIDDLINRTGSSQGRFKLITEGFRYAGENFFIGNGVESVNLDRKYLTSNFQILGKGNTHNLFVTVLIETGFFGLLSLLIFLKSILARSKISIKKSKNEFIRGQLISGKLMLATFFGIAMVSHNVYFSLYFILFNILIASVNKLYDSKIYLNNTDYEYN